MTSTEIIHSWHQDQRHRCFQSQVDGPKVHGAVTISIQLRWHEKVIVQRK